MNSQYEAAKLSAFARRNGVIVFVDFIEPVMRISNLLKSESAGDHVSSVIRE